jgi:hypothetical protein
MHGSDNSCEAVQSFYPVFKVRKIGLVSFSTLKINSSLSIT